MVVAVLAVLALTIPVYLRVGWSRMTDECGFGDNPLPQRNAQEYDRDITRKASVHFSWEVRGGFTCTYSDGQVRQSYWF